MGGGGGGGPACQTDLLPDADNHVHEAAGVLERARRQDGRRKGFVRETKNREREKQRDPTAAGPGRAAEPSSSPVAKAAVNRFFGQSGTTRREVTRKQGERLAANPFSLPPPV